MPETEGIAAEASSSSGSASREGTPTCAPSEREAYFQALRLWIQQAQMYQNFSTCFPYYMMTFQGLNSNVPLLNNNYQVQGQPWPFQVPNPNANGQRNIPPHPAGINPTPTEVIGQHGGYEFVIPCLYKRLIAEFIDFLLLFILKLIVTLVAVDMFEFIDLDKFDIYKIGENLDDFKRAIEITSDIIMLEVIYRLLVCVYEAACLTSDAGLTGGATPGKALLGIRVLSAAAIVPVPNRPRYTVLIYPARPPSFAIAFFRSVLKNFLISLLFPLCFILFVFKHNRTGYDLLAGVIVVEENMYPPRRYVP